MQKSPVQKLQHNVSQKRELQIAKQCEGRLMATSADSLEGAVDRNAKANLQGPTNFKRVP
jgi:hypothetical protein